MTDMRIPQSSFLIFSWPTRYGFWASFVKNWTIRPILDIKVSLDKSHQNLYKFLRITSKGEILRSLFSTNSSICIFIFFFLRGRIQKIHFLRCVIYEGLISPKMRLYIWKFLPSDQSNTVYRVSEKALCFFLGLTGSKEKQVRRYRLS